MKNKRWIKAIAIASCCLALTAAAVAILHSNWDRWFNAQQQAGIVMKLDGDAEEWDASRPVRRSKNWRNQNPWI